MASTYSALKIELIATGEQSGTWGTTTNNNLGDAALGEAITGSADVAFSSGNVTVTLTDSNASQAARNLRLNLTGTTGGARQLILGSGCQIEKLYLINNTCADAITVKNTGGTGIAVPAGKSMFVYNNGTNVVDAVTHLSSLTLGSALPVTSGGTGSTSTTFVNLASNVTGTLPAGNGGTGITSLGAGVATFLGTPSSANLAAAVTNETGSGALVFGTSPTLTTPTLTTPVLGTPSSGTLTSCTGLPISTGVSGLGTGVATFLATPSSANLASAVTDETGSGALVFATSPTLTSPVTAGTPTGVGVLTSGTSVSASGTSVDFTSIPSWVKRITVIFRDVSLNGGSQIQVQLGDSGGVETTGYLGGGWTNDVIATSTSGAPISGGYVASWAYSGTSTILNLSSNNWVFSSCGAASNNGNPTLGGSSKSLSATLDRIRITTINGTDTFDAGTINILFE